MALFTGSGVALCTPFNAKDQFDPVVYEKMIRFQVANGTDAIITCGTTGESPTLADDEHVEVVRAAVAFTKAAAGDKKIPVIAGAGGNDTRHCVELSRKLEKAGVDACMLVTPYYNKTSQKGLVEHFTKIANEISIPVVVYNVPSRTGLSVTAQTMHALSKVENIVAIKEASYNMVLAAEIAELCGDAMTLYSGNDECVLPILALGGKGVISTVGNIAPRQTHEMVTKYLNGDTAGGLALQLSLLPLIRAVFSDVNPIPIKTALNLMGYEAGLCRPPLTTMEPAALENLKTQMVNFGILASE